MKRKIPEEDLKLINDSFKQDEGVETLIKNANGKQLSAKIKVSNEKTIQIIDFSGRILKHQKSVVTKLKQIIVGSKGTKYDDIPSGQRNLVSWNESDFI